MSAYLWEAVGAWEAVGHLKVVGGWEAKVPGCSWSLGGSGAPGGTRVIQSGGGNSGCSRGGMQYDGGKCNADLFSFSIV